ncbi:hypothetical protein [Streptomyces sp. NPDC048496]|uniref:hypothetical protein n=1 Tax=Streptomyces sp. NPDC048496 TaxID=3365558 RepID=UPI0037243AA4
MNTPTHSEDPYQDVPTAVVFDLFAEAANRLTGRLTPQGTDRFSHSIDRRSILSWNVSQKQNPNR